MNVKGQLISKANCQAINSSKKRTNEFVFTNVRLVIVRFLEEIEDAEIPFEINWPLVVRTVSTPEFCLLHTTDFVKPSLFN